MTLSKLAKQDVSQAVKTGLVYFSAVHLATTEFMRHAMPSASFLVLPKEVIAGALLVVQGVPFLLILAADWLIRRNFSSQASMRFRVAVMAGALILVTRQAQLYLGPIKGPSHSIEMLSPVVLAFTVLLVMAGVVYLTYRLHGSVRTFFYYFSPIAIFFSALLPFHLQSENARYANYSSNEVIPASLAADPVFILVFDELSYSALLDDSGEINAVRYPNFARLGGESLHLTNATGNHFHTWVAVPEIIDATLALSSDYEVRLYEQTHRIAAFYADGCGHVYTCRDVNYLRMRHTKDLTLSLAARTLYEALPRSIEKLGRGGLHALLRSFNAVPPSTDPNGIHEISTQLLSVYLDDIRPDKVNGRVFLLHTLVPHSPFLFNRSGGFDTDQSFHFDYDSAQTPTQAIIDEIWPHYEDQVEFADKFLGDVLAVLDREGLYDRSTVIVTSDHGMRFSYPEPNQPIELPGVTPEVLMFIHSPNVEPKKSDVDYQHVDFAATLYDTVGFKRSGLLAPLDRLPGVPTPVSALSPIRPVRDKVFFVDYENLSYWPYVYDSALDVWQALEQVNAPAGDRTELGKKK